MKNDKIIKSAARFLMFFIVIIAAALAYWYYTSNLGAVSSNGGEQEFTIVKGSSVKAIAAQLKQQELIKDANVFILYSKLNEKANKLKAGKYVLNSSMTVEYIVDKLVSGKAEFDTVRFTIPEGFELRQIADRLAADGLVDKEKFYTAIDKAEFKFEFIKAIPNREGKLEGYLFPDTYEVFKNSSEQVILDKMLSKFDKIFTEEYKQRAKEMDMTLDEVIILASIIEREAKLDKDRKTVSAVFHNRLKKNMKLQSCATIQYILKEQKEVLTYKDLEIDSPYNTYIYEGLPVGPISSPGAKSIEAALYPENVDYLYFFALKDGSHVFSRTYEEHIEKQNKYDQ